MLTIILISTISHKQLQSLKKQSKPQKNIGVQQLIKLTLQTSVPQATGHNQLPLSHKQLLFKQKEPSSSEFLSLLPWDFYSVK